MLPNHSQPPSDPPTAQSVATIAGHWLNPRRIGVYSLAILLPFLALFIRWQLPVEFGARPLLILFMPAIILPALLGGILPGLIATLVAAFCTAFFLIPPQYSLAIGASHDLFQWGMLIGSGIMVSIMAEHLHRAKQSLDQLNASLDNRLQTHNAAFERAAHTVEAIVEFAPDAMIIIDAEGRIVMVNSQVEAAFGFNRDALIGQPVETLIPERFRGHHDQYRNAYVQAPVARAMGEGRKLFARRQDGSEFPVSIALNALDTQEGRWVICVIRDVTETYRNATALQDALAQAAESNRALQLSNRELESFSYSVSHDLRAPLRSVDGFSNILLKNYADRLDEQGCNFLQRMRAASQRMSQLIDDMLVLSRISRAELNKERIDLSALVETAVAQLRESFPEHTIEAVIQPGVTVEADRRLVRIVLDNLLGNTWKFTGKTPDARVEFGGEMRNGHMECFVRDNGAGFDMAYADKLFGAFQRLHSANEFPGSGIGLATVMRVIHKHGGEVRAEGAVGQGATFWFTLQP